MGGFRKCHKNLMHLWPLSYYLPAHLEDTLLLINLWEKTLRILVSWEPPAYLAAVFNRLFVAIFNIDMREADRPISSYPSILAIFIRKLKPGLRPVQGQYVSPTDGLWSSTNQPHNNSFIIKGCSYTVAELVDNLTIPSNTFAHLDLFYLAPKDYHRVHAPFTGRLLSIKEIPGTIWPVNKLFVKLIPNVFSKNARMVMEWEVQGAKAYVVLVGAFNVSSIVLSGRVRNWAEGVRSDLSPLPVTVGEEIAWFELGSTVIILLSSAAVDLFGAHKSTDDEIIKVGWSLL